MRPRRSSFPVAVYRALFFVAAGLAGCAHSPPEPRDPTEPAWLTAAPSARNLEIDASEQRRCRVEVPIGSRVPRRVCTTREEDRLRAEAAAEHVRWGIRPAY